VYQIDFNFLRRREGKVTYGYVPRDKKGIIGNSGVTISAGVDLGQRNDADIKALNIPNTLKAKLLPYAGKRLEEAEKFLKLHPLNITLEESDQLEAAVIQKDLTRAIRVYEEHSRIRFETIPPEAQTVFASLAWNFGIGNLLKMPNTWKLLTSQRWKALAELLNDFPSKQPQLDARRKLEAQLLRKI